jgi:hypothetical protein
MKKIKSISFLLLSLILVFVTINPVHGQSKKETPVNIITYNIRYSNTGDGENAWPLRKDKVAGLLRFHEADIFNVQEALIEQINDLKAACPNSIVTVSDVTTGKKLVNICRSFSGNPGLKNSQKALSG